MADMHPEDIKAEIRKAGVTMSALAKAAGVSRTSLSMALHSRVSAKAEGAIASFIGRSPREIWPSRYDEEGRRLSVLEARKVAA